MTKLDDSYQITWLYANGWPSVADDLRDGVSPATILSRLDRMAWEDSEDGCEDESYDEVRSIVAELSATL